MRKIVTALLAVALLMALSGSALALTWTAYVNHDTLKVYEEQDKSSKVVKKLKGGDEVTMEGNYGDWYGIYYDDKKGNECVGYVQSKYMSFAMPEEYCKHKWSEWDVLREPTCAKKGVKTRECSVCGKTEKKDIAKLEHQYGKWTVTEEATCTQKGEEIRKCKVCGNVEEKVLDMLPHEYGKWKVTEEATCTEKGERVRRCSICGHKDVQVLDKLPHEYGKWTVTREASCTEEGERVRKCKFCDHRDVQVLDKLPHDFGSWKVTREATCTKKGKKVRTCRVCGHEETKNIDMLPHSYKWQLTVKTTDHSSGRREKVCTVCGYVDREESFDPDGTLRRGARGDSVKEIQQLLVDQGYLKAGGVDGIFGPGMERAVKQFQGDQGLEPDGVAWPQTIKRLHHDFGEWETVTRPTRVVDGEYVRTCRDCGYQESCTVSAGVSFARRDRGAEIRTLQRMLNDMGYSAGTVDGAYGPKLDMAYENFAAENNLDFASEKLRPVDVDNIVNGWLESIPEAKWKGRGEKNSAVRLVLSVTPEAEADGTSPEEVTTYSWRLSNLGTQRCRFDALLLSFGSDADFLAGNLVMVVGNAELQRDGGNSVSGTFSVTSDWGDGTVHFCAVGTSVSGGETWLSNDRSFGG